MFCRKRDKTLVDLSKGKNRSCAPSKCGGWKWTYPSCLPGGSVCSGISGAWLPAVEVCRLYVWGPSRVASKKVVRGGASGSSSSSAPALMSSSSSSIVSSESSSSSSVRGSSSSSVRGSSSSSVSSGSSSSSSHHSSSSYSSVESSSSSHHSSSSYSSVESSSSTSSTSDSCGYQDCTGLSSDPFSDCSDFSSPPGSVTTFSCEQCSCVSVVVSSSSASEPEASFYISQNPEDFSAAAGAFEAVLFSVSVVAPSSVSYAWQWSLDSGNTWYDINPNGGVFFQADTDAIGIYPGMTDTSSTWNGSRFRAKVTCDGIVILSEVATLTVNS